GREARDHLPTSSVPAGSVPADSVPTSHVPASSILAGGVLAGNIDSAEFGDPAASEYVPAVFANDPAATSPLPPGHSLGSCEHITRFPSPSDLGNHQPTAGIFSSSSYDADFCADVTNLASNVVVDPVATKRVNTIHPQSQIIRDLQSQVQTRVHVAKSLEDPFWVAAMQEEMQQFYHQQVWKLVPLLAGKIAIGTKWILKNKRDARGIVVYVDDIIFGSTNKAWCDEFEVLMKDEFEMSAMGELTFFLGLQVKQLPDGIFISQDKYVKDMLKKFDMESVRTATTPYEVPKHKSKDDPDDAINVHLFRSMIGSLMYLTASRPDIIFAVSACSRHQVIPLNSHLNVVKKIFKYLKGQPNLGLWYPRDSPFQLEAYNDSDYAGSHGDRKSTTGGCQFLGIAVVRSISYSILVYCWMTVVSCGLLLYSISSVSRFPMLRVVQVLIHADDLIPAGSCTIPTGSYLFMLMNLFLLVVVLLLLLLVHADEFVPAGRCTITTGSSSFILLDCIHTYFQAYHICSIFHLSRLQEYFSMAALQYKDDHNKVAYLEKGKCWEAYARILDFLHRSHISTNF
nr:uncharacterized mitochondrial protein AtMg00810-like [Tanacetum cinerariifolium]